MKFNRHMTASGILYASIGAMIGSGWLFSPYYAAQMAGPASLISWFLAGIFTFIIALNFAELGTLFPIAGGVASYPYFTHGKFVGFLFGWISWTTFVVIPPLEVQAAIQYASNFFPSLYNKTGATQHLTSTGYIAAAALMLMLVYVNTRGVKFMSETNKYFSIWKILVPLIAIVAFISHAPHGVSNLYQKETGGFLPYGWQGVLSALAIGGVMFSFNGFQMGILMAAEAKNPHKSIPMAILGSIVFCFVLYSLLQIAFLMIVPKSALLANGWASFTFQGDAGPFAGMALILGLAWVAYLLYIDAVVSPLGAGIVYVATTSRILYAFGANGYLPKMVSKLSGNGTPTMSIWINFFVGMCMFLPFPGWQSMVAFLSSTIIASYMAIPLCLYVLRTNYSDQPRPFKIPAYKIFSFLAFYICNLMLYWTGWTVLFKLLLCIVFGSFIYFAYHIYRMGFLHVKQELIPSIWVFCYFIGLAILSKFGSYGGGMSILKPGYDFLFLLVFSVIIFWLAQKYVLSKQKTAQNINEILEFSKKHMYAKI